MSDDLQPSDHPGAADPDSAGSPGSPGSRAAGAVTVVVCNHDGERYLARVPDRQDVLYHLVGKIRVYCGDMDEYYFNLSTLALKEVLDQTSNPHYGGEVVMGSPLKPHGWHPMNKSELVRMMAAQITKNAPAGENTDAWKHD